MKKILIFIVLLISIAAGISAYRWQNLQESYNNKMMQTLASYGFINPIIKNTYIDKDRLVFTDISLDQDGFSRIDALQLNAPLMDLLLGHTPKVMTADNIVLTGELGIENGLSISGWKMSPLLIPALDELILNGAQLDLVTSEGAIRMQAKGQGLKLASGDFEFNGLLWGIQNQLKFKANTQSILKQDGSWTTQIDINEGKLNLDKLKASRASGWIILDKANKPIPSVSAQMSAGKVTIHDLNFMDFTLAVEGPYNNYKLLGKAKVAGYENVLATLDISNHENQTQIHAVVETQTVEALISFLSDLQSSDTNAGHFTALLLTKGNLERLRKSIEPLEFDVLELQLSGPVFDLSGKVILKSFENGTMKQRVISLDPGTAERG